MINISYRRLLLPLSFCPLLWLVSEPQFYCCWLLRLSDHSCVTVSPLTVVCRPPAERGCSIWVSLAMCGCQLELMLAWALKTANLGAKYNWLNSISSGTVRPLFFDCIPNSVYTQFGGQEGDCSVVTDRWLSLPHCTILTPRTSHEFVIGYRWPMSVQSPELLEGFWYNVVLGQY